MTANFAWTYGIEEEFFLVDATTGALARRVPAAFRTACRTVPGQAIHEELLAPQVEISTPILTQTAQARTLLPGLRRQLATLAGQHGLALLAAGSHPQGGWRQQRPTDLPRYRSLTDEFQIVSRRSCLSALHVHVAVPTRIDRVQLMNRLLPWLPMFLALSASSPFWEGESTGLHSYRQSAYDEWPRSGLPDAFDSEVEYDTFIALLQRSGALRDGSELWWNIRPSSRFPTLELRICDACTEVEDTLALAAAFRCLVRAYCRDPELGASPSNLTRRLVDENRWRAKRHGTAAAFIDLRSGQSHGLSTWLRLLGTLVDADARALGCQAELLRLRMIAAAGNSADRQLRLYRNTRAAGLTHRAALKRVVRWLLERTMAAPRTERAALLHGNVSTAWNA